MHDLSTMEAALLSRSLFPSHELLLLTVHNQLTYNASRDTILSLLLTVHNQLTYNASSDTILSLLFTVHNELTYNASSDTILSYNASSDTILSFDMNFNVKTGLLTCWCPLYSDFWNVVPKKAILHFHQKIFNPINSKINHIFCCSLRMPFSEANVVRRTRAGIFIQIVSHSLLIKSIDIQ